MGNAEDLAIYLLLGAGIGVVVSVILVWVVGGSRSRKKAGDLLLPPVRVKPVVAPFQFHKWPRSLRVSFYVVASLALALAVWSSPESILLQLLPFGILIWWMSRSKWGP